MTKKFIPFGLLPSSWGLEGLDRAKAYAKYTLTGEELDYEMLNLNYTDKSTIDYAKEKLALDIKYKKIKQSDYEREKATLLGESYFKVIQGGYTSTGLDKGTMTFELDWNHIFVNELREAGWTGPNDDLVINAWFEDSCRQMLAEDAIESLEMPINSYNRTVRTPVSGDKSEYS